jgi:class 3 adenylate cyclase
MALSDTLESDVRSIFRTSWQERDGQTVPEAEDVHLGNDAVKLDGVVLYADLAESTALVDGFKPWFAAEIYKTYLHCAAKIIRAEDGVVTAFDGDRVMAVYIGEGKEARAARTALKINHAVVKIINPMIPTEFPSTQYQIRHAVGIDSAPLFVARTGIRGSNDLVWVGRAANYAAKLCALRELNYASYITAPVFSLLPDEVKYGGQYRQPMWESFYWAEKAITLYRSSWM